MDPDAVQIGSESIYMYDSSYVVIVMHDYCLFVTHFVSDDATALENTQQKQIYGEMRAKDLSRVDEGGP